MVRREDDGSDLAGQVSQVGGFIDGTLSFEGGESEFVLASGTFSITKLLTIDEDYWLGWTIYEILRYAPQHNWSAYEEAVKTNPVLAKMMTSGVVYSLGDGLHRSFFLSIFQDWWVVPAKVVFDQTIWAALWNRWRLWPFAHLVTYGLIPLEQRLLYVDCVELIWVTILSTYLNEKSDARILEAPTEAKSNSSPIGPPEE
ncbi:hypothetical protein Dsin_022531 [Dipteronia sinensis]|uniref:Uncharacterized protein n=1 Tax=Dipteronia sinensis TaxID=43782 RepID=A0AAE0A356_9ROSI|nr:hypothetical protein Dsin_022531 [Dipteronia sinensis]